jgi:hypothetical protein
MTSRSLIHTTPAALQAMARDGAEIEIDIAEGRAYLRLGDKTFVAELEVER